MYEFILFFYLVSFLYIAIVTSSWRTGCIESAFWFLINGLFMLYMVVRLNSLSMDYMIILSLANTVRATMLLLMGRGPKTEEESVTSEEDYYIEEKPSPQQKPRWQTSSISKEAMKYKKKALTIASNHAARIGYTIEDFSDKQIGYDLRIAKSSTVNYVMVKIKIEADGVIFVTHKEYEKAKEYRTLYYLYAVLGGVDPWEEEIHIVKNPYAKLHFVYDSSTGQYAIDCDDIRIVSQATYDHN